MSMANVENRRLMRLAPPTVFVFVLLLPAFSFGSTISLGATNSLFIEQTQLLEAQLEKATARCQSAPSELAAEVNLVVDQVYPTTGISPAAVVTSFLVSKGIKSANIQEGQIEAMPASAGSTAIQSPNAEGRTVEVSISCGGGS